MPSNTILIVNDVVVCNDYLQQKACQILTEVDAKFDKFLEEKQQVINFVANKKKQKLTR